VAGTAPRKYRGPGIPQRNAFLAIKPSAELFQTRGSPPSVSCLRGGRCWGRESYGPSRKVSNGRGGYTASYVGHCLRCPSVPPAGVGSASHLRSGAERAPSKNTVSSCCATCNQGFIMPRCLCRCLSYFFSILPASHAAHKCRSFHSNLVVPTPHLAGWLGNGTQVLCKHRV